jgi:hypothetical protein
MGNLQGQRAETLRAKCVYFRVDLPLRFVVHLRSRFCRLLCVNPQDKGWNLLQRVGSALNFSAHLNLRRPLRKLSCTSLHP